MELNDDQFERLVGMLADNRAAIVEAKQEVLTQLDELRNEVKAAQRITNSTLEVIQEDLGKVQTKLREHDQSLDGITQLCKSTFDVAESATKRVIEQANRIENDDAEKSHGAPQ